MHILFVYIYICIYLYVNTNVFIRSLRYTILCSGSKAEIFIRCSQFFTSCILRVLSARVIEVIPVDCGCPPHPRFNMCISPTKPWLLKVSIIRGKGTTDY